MSKPKKKNVPQNGASTESQDTVETVLETPEGAEPVEASAAEPAETEATPETAAPAETPAAETAEPAAAAESATEPAAAGGSAETQGSRAGSGKKKPKKPNPELEAARQKLETLDAMYVAEHDKHLRVAAEYENFRRRTVKEKEAIRDEAAAESIKAILPIIDTLERAAAGLSPEDAETPLGKGILLTLKSATEALAKMGVEEIPAEIFDPEIHNAVMHVEDDSLPEGAIAEVFLKGYRKGDRVIRYAMVKVAN